MSDGSWSHCKMMSESTRQFNIFTPHVTANVSVSPFVSTTVDVPYPNDFTHMPNTFSPLEAATCFKTRQSHRTMGSSLSSVMRSIRLCVSACALHLTHDVHHGLNGMCVNSFLRLGMLTWYGDWLRSCLDRSSVVVYMILNNLLHKCVITLGRTT